MLAFPEESFSRTFDLFGYDFENNEEEGTRVIFEAVGAELECDTIDYDFFDNESIHLRGCSSGVPSCSSSPCSSERDYGVEKYSFADSFQDIEETEFDLAFHSCSNQIKRTKTHIPKQERKNIQRRNKCSSRRKERRKNELDRVMTCLECRWSELNTQKQQETLEMLIGTVSQRLGLREQLQLIRIICPDADVSPNDKEFFIDFDLFDDDKFRGVCNFVKHHLLTMKETQKEGLSRKNSRKSKESKNSPPPLWMGKTKSIESKLLAKTSRQIKKEQKSGLFKQEEVLLLKEDQAIIQEEDEELDVVG
eukprot:Seg1249.18 transcript_id=Seg1249.18/GoldUCD/mRNA.D3Y31 product="Protein FAM199X" protein_id=Seg1249.18/GoldUCD/D3Y31